MLYGSPHKKRTQILLLVIIVQRSVGRADRLHARKQSSALPPLSDIADYYLQSAVLRFRCLLHCYYGVYMLGDLPSARHAILLIAFAYHFY